MPVRSNTRRYVRTPPPIITGVPLDVDYRLVLPLLADTTNLFTNPSFELNTTNANPNSGATLARTTAFQRRGAYALQVTPTASLTDGVFFPNSPGLTLTAGQPYSTGFDFYGPAGLSYLAFWNNVNSVRVSKQLAFTGKGYWERQFLPFIPPLNGTYYLVIIKNNVNNLVPFYVDGLAVCAVTQANLGPLLYFDGDSMGFIPTRQDFYWTGTPHGSTSVMIGQSRAAGRIVSLSSYGFIILALLGLGQTPLVNQELQNALLGGSVHQRGVKQPRTFDVMGHMSYDSRIVFERNLASLESALNVDSVTDQEMMFQYQPLEDDGITPGGETFNIRAKYVSGLEGKRDNAYAENLDLKFRIYLPVVATLDGSQGTTLAVQQTLTVKRYFQRSVSGLWNIGAPLAALGADSGFISAIVIGLDGTVYFCGSFSGFDQVVTVPNTNYIASYNPTTGVVSAMGTGGAGGTSVNGMVLAPDGTIIAMGDFTSMGGVALTNHIAKWDPVALSWSSIASAVTGAAVYNGAYDAAGNLYVTGSFTNIGGVAANNIAYRDIGGTWHALGTGLSAAGTSIAVGPDNSVYVMGTFVTANGVTVNNIAKWNGTTFVSLAGGSSSGADIIRRATFLPNGYMVVVGTFTTVGGIAAVDIAQWNGQAWSALGSGVTTGVTVYRVVVQPDGTLLFSGNVTVVGGLTQPGPLFQWNGTAYVYADVSLPGTASVFALATALSKTVYIGWDTAGTGIAAALTTLINSGSANAYPIFKISHPASATAVSPLYQIKNYTTGEALYFNLSLAPGETVIIDLSLGRKTITSNVRGNLFNTLLPGSNLSTWHLQPGANTVSVFMTVASGALPTMTAWWQPLYNSIEPAIR